MCQTIFTIPAKILGIDVFGVGWLLAVWAVVSVAMLAWLFKRHGFGPETRSHLPGLALAGAAIAFLLPRLSLADGLPIRGYGVMLLLALVLSIGLAAWRAERLGLDPDMILSLAFWLVTSGILGARVFYIIEYYEDRFHKPTLLGTLSAMLDVSQGGLVVYGSLLAGGAALIGFVYRYRVPGLALSDLVAPSVVLGVAVGRLGCFMNGCCYGGPSDLPWAVSFPWASPAHAAEIERGELPIRWPVVPRGPQATPVIARVDADSTAAHAGLAAGQELTSINGLPIDSVEEPRRWSTWQISGTAATSIRSASGRSTGGQSRVAGDPRPKLWMLSGDQSRQPADPSDPAL